MCAMGMRGSTDVLLQVRSCSLYPASRALWASTTRLSPLALHTDRILPFFTLNLSIKQFNSTCGGYALLVSLKHYLRGRAAEPDKSTGNTDVLENVPETWSRGMRESI